MLPIGSASIFGPSAKMGLNVSTTSIIGVKVSNKPPLNEKDDSIKLEPILAIYQIARKQQPTQSQWGRRRGRKENVVGNPNPKRAKAKE